MDRKIIITGCGRSATQYISKVCQLGGKDIQHELSGKDGVSSWYATFSDTSDPTHKIKIPYYKEAIVLHQVRNFLKTIESCQVFENDSWNTWEYISKHIPEINLKDSLIKRCMIYWHYWNLKAEEKAVWTYKVEDLLIPVNFDRFCATTGIDSNYKSDMLKVPKNLNKKYRKRFYPKLTLLDLFDTDYHLSDRILRQAKRYGYEV